jgi:hypothetical protein
MDASWKLRGGPQVPGPVGDSARLLVAGDTHGNLDWIGTLSKLAARHGCQGVVHLGDFGLWPDQRVWRSELRAVINDRWLDAVAERAAHHGVWWRFIDGNHDAHPVARHAYPADDNGVRPIRTGLLDWADRGAVWSWCGVRFGGLGGGVSIDRQFRKEGQSWWPTEFITDDDVNTLIDRAGPEGVDVLVCHDAPIPPNGVRRLAAEDLAVACPPSNRRYSCTATTTATTAAPSTAPGATTNSPPSHPTKKQATTTAVPGPSSNSPPSTPSPNATSNGQGSRAARQIVAGFQRARLTGGCYLLPLDRL